MLSCEETTRLISESLDRVLPFRQRMAVWAHLLMCRYCSRYRKQLLFIEKAISQVVEGEREGLDPIQWGPSLSPEARERIGEALRRKSG
ncbi:MAG: zf-HC2 domain-containing protein [Syntrophobacteraceae bacterium]|jgi:hypothetical protein|nr:zf-HC2 domain-containing protein [Syntrophobacteraceae bacterium]